MEATKQEKLKVKKDLERALLACGTTGGFVLLGKGPALEMDLENLGGLDLADSLPLPPEAPTHGLWVVDVVPHWSRGYEGEGDEASYDGATFRRPNLGELVHVLKGDLAALAASWVDVLALPTEEQAMQAAEDHLVQQLDGAGPDDVLAMVHADASTRGDGFSPEQEKEISAALNDFLTERDQ